VELLQGDRYCDTPTGSRRFPQTSPSAKRTLLGLVSLFKTKRTAQCRGPRVMAKTAQLNHVLVQSSVELCPVLTGRGAAFVFILGRHSLLRLIYRWPKASAIIPSMDNGKGREVVYHHV
jgi:hypothetical protein